MDATVFIVTDSQQKTAENGASTWMLLGMGVLWILFAIGIPLYQRDRAGDIEIEWTTETEQQTAGFHLYRSEFEDNAFIRISDEMIPAHGSAVSGASYTYIDQDLPSGVTYYYLLEEIEYDASAHKYEEDIFSHNVPTTTWWVLLLSGLSALIGFALLIMGIKEKRHT